MKTLEKINIWSFTVKLIEIEERPHESKWYKIEITNKNKRADTFYWWIAGDKITAFEKYIEACKTAIERHYYNEINYYYK
jgi:hypothetical protein